jgi:hypothetical protein
LACEENGLGRDSLYRRWQERDPIGVSARSDEDALALFVRRIILSA